MTALLANAAATLFMTGLIWFVQVVHYPLFAFVSGPGAAAYAARHHPSFFRWRRAFRSSPSRPSPWRRTRNPPRNRSPRPIWM